MVEDARVEFCELQTSYDSLECLKDALPSRYQNIRNKLNAKRTSKFPFSWSETSLEAAHLISVEPPASQTYWPVFLVLCSSLFIGVSNVCIRNITARHNIEPIFVVFLRGFLQVFVTVFLIYAVWEQSIMSSFEWRIVVFLMFRGLLGATCILFKYHALARLPVVIGSSLFSTSPIFASLMGWMLLDVELTGTDGASLLLTLSGAGLVGFSEGLFSEVSIQATDLEGVVLALLTAVSGASLYVLMRWMGTSVHFLFCALSHSLCSMLMAFCLHLTRSNDFHKSIGFFYETTFHSSREATIGFLSAMMFGVIGSICMNYASQRIAPGRVSLLRSSDIPFNFMLGFLFLQELPSTLQAIGCIFMAVSAYLVSRKSSS